ncbi:hypothetical protein O0L34_g18955 [Tuta absoluta]|nr:hypothetical protein O0L34_g18955 [Tuta absoluta]
MVDCKQCSKPITEAELLTCSQCTCKYHYKCTGMLKMNYTKLTPDTKLAWICPTCKNRDAGANISALIQEQLTIFEATLLPKFQAMIIASIDTRIPVKLDALNELPELIKSIKFMSENYDKVNKEVENLRSEVTDFRFKNTTLDKQVSELSHKMAQVEQQARECNLELQCIPEHKIENLVKVAVQLGSIVRRAT